MVSAEQAATSALPASAGPARSSRAGSARNDFGLMLRQTRDGAPVRRSRMVSTGSKGERSPTFGVSGGLSVYMSAPRRDRSAYRQLPISPKAVIYRSLARSEQFPTSQLVRLDEALAERINAFRFRERFKTEADAIRELIRRGLEGATETKPTKAQAR